MPVLTRYTRSLPCALTHDELVKAVRELSAVLEVTAHEESDQKAKKKAMASRLADLDNQRQELGRKITLGRENRDVEVQVNAEYDKGIAIEIRTDSFEVVNTRPLTPEEKQLGLPMQVEEGDKTRPMACQVDGCGHLLENHEGGCCTIDGCKCPGFVAGTQELAIGNQGTVTPEETEQVIQAMGLQGQPEEELIPVETTTAPTPSPEPVPMADAREKRRKKNGR